MQIDDPAGYAAWKEWAEDSPTKRATEKAERLRQRARRAYPPSPEEVAATDFKVRAAEAWSAGAVRYAAAMHGDDGGGLMAPLTRHFVRLVRDALRHAEGFDSDPYIQRKVLDAASGPGEPAGSIARDMPQLCVLAADLAPGMREEGDRRWCRRHDEGNVIGVVMDAEATSDMPVDTISAITCCGGLQFMPAYERALAEWHRVLQDDALLAISVPKPGGVQSAELAAAVLAAAAPEERLLAPPCAFSDIAALLGAIAAAGFYDIQSTDVTVPIAVPADGLQAHVTADPLVLDVLQRLKAAGRPAVCKEVEDAAGAAARDKGWLHGDGGVAMTDVHVVISAKNGAKPKKEPIQLPDFMEKKIREYQAILNAPDDGGIESGEKSDGA